MLALFVFAIFTHSLMKGVIFMEINMEELRENFKKYAPEILYAHNIIHMMAAQHIVNDRRLRVLEKSYGIMNKEYAAYKHRVSRRTHSNNWLKLHGYPMRRGKENRDLRD